MLCYNVFIANFMFNFQNVNSHYINLITKMILAFSSHHQFQFDLILLLAFNVQSLVLCKSKMFAHCECCENVKVNFSCLIKTAFFIMSIFIKILNLN